MHQVSRVLGSNGAIRVEHDGRRGSDRGLKEAEQEHEGVLVRLGGEAGTGLSVPRA